MKTKPKPNILKNVGGGSGTMRENLKKISGPALPALPLVIPGIKKRKKIVIKINKKAKNILT
jgi:hypothetical protein